jgi:hypothetical protein
LRGWAAGDWTTTRLLRKVFEVKPLRCPRCQTVTMKVVAIVTDHPVVDRILGHRRARGMESVFDTRPARAPPAA